MFCLLCLFTHLTYKDAVYGNLDWFGSRVNLHGFINMIGVKLTRFLKEGTCKENFMKTCKISASGYDTCDILLTYFGKLEPGTSSYNMSLVWKNEDSDAEYGVKSPLF